MVAGKGSNAEVPECQGDKKESRHIGGLARKQDRRIVSKAKKGRGKRKILAEQAKLEG
ncbi:MAG: hypothetical protein Metus_0332 [Candidatus Methanosuratincola subterraneus]|uniref:Uncharacterized protein n=1 Tax=Methanosuratincola subterraneus TaxID=2593994 RepID=A0A3S3RFJ8_METS7|nr:MAG: hypothetical protein Metus_0332 [Candidatus Methanosuratincola subterraneus]